MQVIPHSRSLPLTAAGAAAPPEVAGVPVAPDMVLPSGIRLRMHDVAGVRPTRAAVRDAIRGILQLPEADQRLIASLKVPVELIPVTHLEALPGTTAPVVGATRIHGPDGSARVARIRIASQQESMGWTTVEECVQHELGHVVGVTRFQNLTEAFAEGYAVRH